MTETTDQNGSITAKFAQGQSIDEPLAESTSSGTDYYEADGLGSITSLTNSAGQVAQTYTYDSFGNTTHSTGSLANPFQYTARDFDSETGLYYYRARYYDPTVGRFLSEDSLRFSGSGSNFYAYAADNPTDFIDPLGDTITVSGDTVAFGQAVSYLSRDPGMLTIYNDLVASSTNYNVDLNSIGLDDYVPGTHTINWDPHSALCTTNGGRQTPALGLGHEMAHADGGWWGEFLSFIPWPQYDNLEERRVITGPETAAAHTLGEGTRTDHRGTPYPVQTPTSTKPVSNKGCGCGASK